MSLMVTFAIWNFSISHISGIQRVIYDMFTHESECTRMACNFKYLLENEGFLKVTASHVGLYCKCGNISEMVPDSFVVILQITTRKWYMTYRIEAILMTLSHLQGRSYCKPFKCDFFPRDAMLSRCLPSSHVRPSVRPPVCHKSELYEIGETETSKICVHPPRWSASNGALAK